MWVGKVDQAHTVTHNPLFAPQVAMTIALIAGSSDERLWGLTSHERIARQLDTIGGINLTTELESISGETQVLIVRADYTYDLPTLKGLLGHQGMLMDGVTPAAAHVRGSLAQAALDVINGSVAQSIAPTAPGGQTRTRRDPSVPDSIPAIDARGLDGFEADLRKSEPPLLQRLAPESASALEDRLYGISYKGITDFVTKWWWPVPAKAMVRWCAQQGVTPNAVTLTGFALMLATCWLFYEGQYFWGLLLGWIMTYLDTVDGKLARVTVRSSKFGHWLDHGMDIVHPPFWYWLWGLSLANSEPWLGVGFDSLVIAMVAGYAAGRLIEGAFHSLGAVSLFAWRPFDAWFRLFVARRNPCLVLLTAGWLLGEPGLGFELVAFWTLVSSVILLGRLAFACYVRVTGEPLTSWLADDDAPRKHPRSHRTFSATRRAYE